MAAHLGQKKTLQRLRQCVYWPGMFVDVQKMCRACPDCQRSVRVLKPKAPLVPVPIIDIPFERIAMDIIGPLPRTKAGNCYILTLMDYGSRYPEAIPIRQTDSKTIAQALIGLFSRVGIPREILTDCGANLTGKLMSDICRLMDIKQLKTSPYHPQTDGMLERFERRYTSSMGNGTKRSHMCFSHIGRCPVSRQVSIPLSCCTAALYEVLYSS